LFGIAIKPCEEEAQQLSAAEMKREMHTAIFPTIKLQKFSFLYNFFL
jgi:hypothetical protein